MAVGSCEEIWNFKSIAYKHWNIKDDEEKEGQWKFDSIVVLC